MLSVAPQRVNAQRAYCLPAAYSQGAPPAVPRRHAGQGSQEASSSLWSVEPTTKASAGPGWVLFASCLFHREGQREIQHTPASSRPGRPSLSVTAAAPDNRLCQPMPEAPGSPQPTSKSAGGGMRGPGETVLRLGSLEP